MIQIGGLQKTTLIDYPQKLACTVFLIGCDFKCPWCYSSELVLPEKIKKQPRISEKEFFSFLKKRRGLLEGITICGGEPCINKDLPNFIKKIKKLGYLVKLDTNGSNPKMLQDLIDKKLIDYVAMDIKAPKEKYNEATGVKVNIKKIQKSIDVLKKEKIDYELRSTLVPGLNKEDIIKITEWIGPAKKYFLQKFYNQKEVIDPKILKSPVLTEEEAEVLIEDIKLKFEICKLR